MISLSPSYTQRELKWTDWKAFKSKKELVHQYEEFSDKYFVWGYDSPEVYVCVIYKSIVPPEVIESGYTQAQNDSDKLDFESNFKSKSNFRISGTNPFSKKVLGGGFKLYRRKHGASSSIAANSSGTIELVIPYVSCKINIVEVIGCYYGDTVNLKVYDTPQGTLSTIPNYMLNQFGFNVEMPDGFYKDESSYDADLIQNMKIELTYFNNGENEKHIGVNFTLHEIV